MKTSTCLIQDNLSVSKDTSKLEGENYKLNNIDVLQMASGAVCDGGREPVVPSARHTVLCQVPGGPAAPTSGDRWDEQHVRLPCSPENLYPQQQPDGSTRLVKRWHMVQVSW